MSLLSVVSYHAFGTERTLDEITYSHGTDERRLQLMKHIRKNNRRNNYTHLLTRRAVSAFSSSAPALKTCTGCRDTYKINVQYYKKFSKISNVKHVKSVTIQRLLKFRSKQKKTTGMYIVQYYNNNNYVTPVKGKPTPKNVVSKKSTLISLACQ